MKTVHFNSRKIAVLYIFRLVRVMDTLPARLDCHTMTYIVGDGIQLAPGVSAVRNTSLEI